MGQRSIMLAKRVRIVFSIEEVEAEKLAQIMAVIWMQTLQHNCKNDVHHFI